MSQDRRPGCSGKAELPGRRCSTPYSSRCGRQRRRQGGAAQRDLGRRTWNFEHPLWSNAHIVGWAANRQSEGRDSMRNGVGVSKRVALVVMATGLVGLAAAFPRAGVAQIVGPPAQFPGPADFHGYSTGTAVHTDALQAGLTGPQVANVEEAFSGASVASQGTNTLNAGNTLLPPPSPPNEGVGASPRQKGKINNELGQTVQGLLPGTDAKLGGDRSYARGSGLEVGLGNNVPAGSNPLALA